MLGRLLGGPSVWLPVEGQGIHPSDHGKGTERQKAPTETPVSGTGRAFRRQTQLENKDDQKIILKWVH